MPEAATDRNAGIHAFLRAGARRARSRLSRRDPELDGWELRCHPDLVERVNDAGLGLAAVFRFEAGLPVLTHPNGVVFAVAVGTSRILVRLPPSDRDGVVRSRWGIDDLDPAEWVDVEPWLELPEREAVAALHEWLARALAHAERT